MIKLIGFLIKCILAYVFIVTLVVFLFAIFNVVG